MMCLLISLEPADGGPNMAQSQSWRSDFSVMFLDVPSFLRPLTANSALFMLRRSRLNE
jgi:hypothetical protein